MTTSHFAETTSPLSANFALRAAVVARLSSDPRVSTAHVDVSAMDGVVTLSGYVTSHSQKDAARAAMRDLGGVERMVDEVLVAVPCPLPPYASSQVVEPGQRAAASVADTPVRRPQRAPGHMPSASPF